MQNRSCKGYDMISAGMPCTHTHTYHRQSTQKKENKTIHMESIEKNIAAAHVILKYYCWFVRYMWRTYGCIFLCVCADSMKNNDKCFIWSHIHMFFGSALLLVHELRRRRILGAVVWIDDIYNIHIYSCIVYRIYVCLYSIYRDGMEHWALNLRRWLARGCFRYANNKVHWIHHRLSI